MINACLLLPAKFDCQSDKIHEVREYLNAGSGNHLPFGNCSASAITTCFFVNLV